MNCPRCSRGMREVERGGLTLDLCDACGGVWLDRGELEQLFELLRALDGDEDESHWRPRGRREPPSRLGPLRDEPRHESGGDFFLRGTD